jgi:hypothetical protein
MTIIFILYFINDAKIEKSKSGVNWEISLHPHSPIVDIYIKNVSILAMSLQPDVDQGYLLAENDYRNGLCEMIKNDPFFNELKGPLTGAEQVDGLILCLVLEREAIHTIFNFSEIDGLNELNIMIEPHCQRMITIADLLYESYFDRNTSEEAKHCLGEYVKVSTIYNGGVGFSGEEYMGELKKFEGLLVAAGTYVSQPQAKRLREIVFFDLADSMAKQFKPVLYPQTGF